MRTALRRSVQTRQLQGRNHPVAGAGDGAMTGVIRMAFSLCGVALLQNGSGLQS